MEPIKILELKINKKKVESKTFYYIDLGGDVLTKRIWINSLYFQEELKDKLGKYKDTIGILKNAQITTTSKLNYVIRKGVNNLFFILVKCGYRGSSEIKVLSEYVNLINFSHYHSPRGNLGISDGVIVETQKDFVKIEWYRSGKLYGEPGKGIAIIRIDGSIESIDLLLNEELEQI
jgi:hypothetical protein